MRHVKLKHKATTLTIWLETNDFIEEGDEIELEENEGMLWRVVKVIIEENKEALKRLKDE